MANETMMRNLIQGIQQRDPRLYDALNQIIGNLQKLNKNVDQLSAENLTPELIDIFVPDVAALTANVYPTYIEFNWEAPDLEVIGYELRKGTDWDTSDFILTTGSVRAQINPIITGTHSYLIKALGSGGTESLNATSVIVNVNPPGLITVIARVVDNNVLLTWSDPTSTFQIKNYKIEKDTVLIGYREGTFTVVFEQIAGTYSYTITPYDIAGNAGPASSISAIVNQPPDYVLQDSFSDDFTGTKSGVSATVTPTLLCNVSSETWQSHFTSRGWGSPQNQVDSGYAYYMQPTPLTGTYTRQIDYGVVISGTIVNIDWAFQLIAGSGHNITCRLRTSTDGTTWSSWSTTTSLFVASLRYLQVELTFTALS